VPLIGSELDATPTRKALTIARQFEAHVDGLFVRADPAETLPMLSDGLTGGMIGDIVVNKQQDVQRRVVAAEEAFAAECQAAGVPFQDMPAPGLSARWRDLVGRAGTVAEEGRTNDLIVFGWRGMREEPFLALAFEAALVDSGRPILMAPEGTPKPLGGVVALAWNATEAAVHAVNAVMPLLRSAGSVHVMVVNTKRTSTVTGKRLERYLNWHGISCTLDLMQSSRGSVGDTLLNTAADMKADLLVMGAYGHSRIRELVMGGVTRHILDKANLPVLLAH
jgi:nucleotide-binding universal stress UspA family protein